MPDVGDAGQSDQGHHRPEHRVTGQHAQRNATQGSHHGNHHPPVAGSGVERQLDPDRRLHPDQEADAP
ncbi:MAG TPA: hypothetical protein VFE93_04820, partial [Myxococcaceae bacterium]|nr:hypothetical protein [Myxococcaceae bacterium]